MKTDTLLIVAGIAALAAAWWYLRPAHAAGSAWEPPPRRSWPWYSGPDIASIAPYLATDADGRSILP